MFESMRKDFPILHEQIHGKPLIYFDNAATTQKPESVLDAVHTFYTRYNANIHRGVHLFTERATQLYEQARATVAASIGADAKEIVFTKGTTESINFVASTWGKQYIHAGDEILITELEHHANLVPWQQLAREKNAFLRYIPVNSDGTLQLDRLADLVTPNTKLIALSHSSNTLGVHNDMKAVHAYAKQVGAALLVDAAQSAPHQRLDVRALDCDFLAFSGHKMLGPTGIGVLYIKHTLHERLEPYQYGGGMVFEVDLYRSQWRKAPHAFEAGTPPIAQAIGLAAAIEYLQEHVDVQTLQSHEAALCARIIDGLKMLKKVQLFGPLEQLRSQGHLVSFAIDGMHAHDVATYLSYQGICVRAGHQCAQPLARKLGIQAAVRASFYLYNTLAEVDLFLESLEHIIKTYG
jgi:cysteine desulfurase / selenocysteine lyase